MTDLDDTAVSELRRVLGADFGTLVDTFVTDSERRLAVMNAAFAAGDLEALRETAHSFKGSSLNVGAQRLAAACLAIETGAREGDLVGLATSIRDAESAFRVASSLLRTR